MDNIYLEVQGPEKNLTKYGVRPKFKNIIFIADFTMFSCFSEPLLNVLLSFVASFLYPSNPPPQVPFIPSFYENPPIQAFMVCHFFSFLLWDAMS